MTGEEWRDVVGYEGLYQVSSLGRVKSLERYCKHPNGGDKIVRGRLLSSRNNTGYQKVALCCDGVPRNVTVHKVVCAAFIGEKPKGFQVRHLNGVPTDNRAVNLVYGTAAENAADRVTHGTNAQGVSVGSAKLTDAKVLEIRRLLAESDLTQTEIGEMFGVEASNISAIKLWKTWKHLEDVE